MQVSSETHLPLIQKILKSACQERLYPAVEFINRLAVAPLLVPLINSSTIVEVDGDRKSWLAHRILPHDRYSRRRDIDGGRTGQYHFKAAEANIVERVPSTGTILLKSEIWHPNLAITDPKAISKYHSARDILSSVPAMPVPALDRLRGRRSTT
jgi:hypothetical protein